ncbi:MAG: extracellular solute-binding protein [Clostridia bacterium]|nr:extracellular solute-binding protein [Clostridia bacterium]
MKKQLKSVFVGTLATATLLLAACGGGGGNVGNSNVSHIDTPWWTTEGTLNVNEDGSPKFENVSISLSTIVTGSDITPFREIVSEFNKQHEGQIKVEVNSVNEATYAQDLANRIQNNTNPPDLLMSHAKLQKTLANEKLIQPLEDIIELTGYDIDWNDYSDVFAKESNLGFDNATFTIPIDMQSEIILYNKAILKELDMGVPSTREDLLAVCEAFKAKYTGSDYYAISMPTNNAHFHPYVYPTAYLQNGGTLYDVETYKADWTSAANTKAFEDANNAILSLKDAGYMKINEGETEAQLRFYNDKTLFLVIPPWNITTNGGVFDTYATQKGISKDDAELVAKMCDYIGGMSLSGLFAMDPDKACAEYVYVDSHSFSVSNSVKDANKKAACLYFAKWFTENGEAGVKWALAGHSSCSSKIINNNDYKNNVFVKTLIQNFYDVNVVRTMGNNPYAKDFVETLGSLTPSLLSRPTQLASLVESKQKIYNGIIELNEIY